MSNKKNTDVVLVYDRYYAKKPKAAQLALQRVILCCGITLCAMMFLRTVYRFPVSIWLTGALCVGFSAIFSLMFIFVKKRFAVTGSLAFAALLILINHEEFYAGFSYFTDAVWLLMDGRFISSAAFTVHTKVQLAAWYPEYVAGVTLGFTLLIILFAMITAASMFSKPRIVPSFVTWVALWSVVLISEKFTFNWWIVPALALYAGALAMSVTHRDGLALRSGMGASYRAAAANSERDYLRTINKTPYGKRTEMSAVYYSKYFSVAIYATAVVTLLGVVSGILLSNTHGFDYTEIYDWFKSVGQSIGQRFSETSPFDEGPVADYFSSPSKGAASHSAGLTITSPGRSNQEILRVTNNGTSAVYLRGDIGIDFKGDTWTSHVNNEPREWQKNGLADYYRPVDVLLLQSLRQNYFDDLPALVSVSDITVDYLVESNVAFFPAYTSDFGYYENDAFDIYGDFVARVESSKEDNMGLVRCTALVPYYTNTDENLGDSALYSFLNAVKIAENYDIAAAADNFFGRDGMYAAYEEYVYNTYLGVPKDMQKMLEDYLDSTYLRATVVNRYLRDEYNGFETWLSYSYFDGTKFIEIDEDEYERRRIEGDNNVSVTVHPGDMYKIEAEYRVAHEIARYLYNRYTYSLDTVNTSDPIGTFLNDTRTGHCALYATSMTLLMRELGIPARYCTGFVAQPNGGLPTVLRSKNLHAWCEVYFSGVGWVTFDPTSSAQNPLAENRPDSSSSSSGSSSVPESDSDSSDSESSSNSEASSENSDNSAENSSGITTQPPVKKVNILPYVLTALVIILIVSLIIAIVQRYKRFLEKVQIALKRYYKLDDAEAILGKIIAVLKVCGLSPGRGELPEKFYARAETTLGCAVLEYRELLEAAAFSGEISDEADCAKLAGLLNQLYTAAENQLKFPGRIKLRLTILS